MYTKTEYLRYKISYRNIQNRFLKKLDFIKQLNIFRLEATVKMFIYFYSEKLSSLYKSMTVTLKKMLKK